MKRLIPLLLLALVPCLLPAVQPSKPVGGNPADAVFYVGGSAKTCLESAFQLSDGTILVGGGSESLGWLPPDVKPVALVGAMPRGGDTGVTPFLLHLSADGKKVLGAYTLLPGCAEDVCSIKTSSVPGKPTGDLFIAGRVRKDPMTSRKSNGYFIAKLDGNFVDKPATKLVWGYFASAEGAMRAGRLPWDVASDGSVVYATGNPYSYDWAAIEKLGPDGKRTVVPNWRRHWVRTDDGGEKEFEGLAKDAPGKPVYSAIVLKIWDRGDFRSWTEEDWKAKVPDGNGGYNHGQWPFDGMFTGPYDPATKKTIDLEEKGNWETPSEFRGSYRYRWGANPTACVGAIVIDRRDDTVYIGGNNQSRLPAGQPDFEPWVIALDKTGAKKWWVRLYPESKGVSTPDQYVDGLAIDYTVPLDRDKGCLVVLARCHGNNVNNLWNGTKIERGNGKSFQPSFTGTFGNAHYGWIGRMTETDGTMLAATFVGEYGEGSKHGNQPFSNPLLDHWPSTTSGWPNLNTTRVHSIATDAQGRVFITATGRRVVTTKNAFQAMPSPLADPGKFGTWSDFVRVYAKDLSDLDYSSILNGQWDWAEEKNKNNSQVELVDAIPVQGGVLVVGKAPANKQGVIEGNDMPTRNVPVWGSAKHNVPAGVFAFLKF